MLSSAPASDARSAETCLEQAIATADRQSARWWEARARIDLARFLAVQQREGAARSVIEPLRAWGGDIDLPERGEAEGLLQRLGH